MIPASLPTIGDNFCSQIAASFKKKPDTIDTVLRELKLFNSEPFGCLPKIDR